MAATKAELEEKIKKLEAEIKDSAEIDTLRRKLAALEMQKKADPYIKTGKGIWEGLDFAGKVANKVLDKVLGPVPPQKPVKKEDRKE